MRYSANFFKVRTPEWKRRKDPFLTKKFYRPLSYYISSFAANHGVSANTVSYLSVIVALVGCGLLFIDDVFVGCLAAVLFNIWLLLDCVDGNLARCVKKQAFGPFADSMSSYILVGFMGISMGYFVYTHGGILCGKENPWMLILGGGLSISDILMRLVYQKYKNTEKELINEGLMQQQYDIREDNSQVTNWKIRVESELGIGGIIPLGVLVSIAFDALDIMIIYCFFYYFFSFVFVTISMTIKAIRLAKNINMDQ